MQQLRDEMDTQTKKNVDAWLSGSYDEATKNEIRKLQKENPHELIDAFYSRLEFGTGGLRGKMGVGSNRMNVYTVRAATQGLANYLNKQPNKEKVAVLIGYDSRNNSHYFAQETAKVLASNDIQVYLYNTISPVALVSFGLLHKKCSAAVMITASHNPPIYNGYKVWWSNGAQVLPPHDSGIIEEVNKIQDPSAVKITAFPPSMIQEVGEDLYSAYLQTIRNLQLYPSQNRSKGKNLKIVYTSLHGAGITIVPKALTDWGFSNITYVDEQCKIDGNFPTVKSPNPEEPEALKMGTEKLKLVNGDILLATDPDADRIAVVVMHNNQPIALNGNETACILLDHICTALKDSHSMPPKAVCIKTIVTTELFAAIANHFGINHLDVLTGFKYIGEKIAEWEDEAKGPIPSHHYIFGGEESYGTLYGTHARDKDAVIAAALIAETALHLKEQNKTLIDYLYAIYHKYGVFREKLLSMTFEGKEGVEKMHNMMNQMRQNPPKMINGVAVEVMEDYLTHSKMSLVTGHKEPLLLPKSDVLRFFLADKTKIVVRPSGTEPKIKVYVGCYDKHFLTDFKAIQKSIQSTDLKAEEYLRFMKQMLG